MIKIQQQPITRTIKGISIWTTSISTKDTLMVFASPLGQFYRDVTTSYHLPGLSNLDKSAWTR